MTNYIRSEIYRNIHSKGIYIFTIVCSSLVLLCEVIMRSFHVMHYEGLKMIYNNMIDGGFAVVFSFCPLFFSITFGDEAKNHTLKNSVAYGISRKEIYFAKLFTSVFFGTISYIIIIAILIIGSYILPFDKSNMLYLKQLILSFIYVMPLLILLISFCNCLYFIFHREGVIVSIWTIAIAVPALMGNHAKQDNFLKAVLNYSPINMIIDTCFNKEKGMYILKLCTDEGLRRCLIVSAVGIVVSYAIGLIVFNKKEIK